MLDTFRQDARYAVRGLGRSPVFSITAIRSIAIGVGGTAAIFARQFAAAHCPPGIAILTMLSMWAHRRTGAASTTSPTNLRRLPGPTRHSGDSRPSSSRQSL